jgi:hypothetical protein
LNDEKTWYAVNRFFAPWLAATGSFIALTAFILALIQGISLDAYALSVLAVLVIVFGTGVMITVRFMNRIK